MSSSSLSKELQFNHLDLSSSKIHTFMGLSGKRLQYAVSSFAGVGFLLFGYDQGVMGSLLTLPSFEKTFPAMKSSNNATLQGAVIAIYEIGCMCSALSTMYLGDKLGRIKIMFMGSIIATVGGALQACAYTVPHLIVARIITGIGVGYITATVPVYQSESSHAKSRGKLIMMQGSIVSLGVMVSYWVDFGFYFLDKGKTSEVSWRFPVAFQVLFTVILVGSALSFPESPRWLIKKGRNAEARQVFSALYGLPEDHNMVSAQVDEIIYYNEKEKAEGADNIKLREIFRQGPNRNFHRISLAVWGQVFNQFCGINLITYYAGTIFEQYIHMSPFNARILAAANGTEYFLASLLGLIFIERLGRRFLLIFGTVGQAIAMACLTATTWAADNGSGSKAGIAAAVFLFVFNSFFGVSYLGASWLIPPEILSLQMRATGSALSTATNWASNFTVVMITPVAFETIGPYTYTIFAVINLLIISVHYFLLPETAGRSLEEMDDIFSQTPVWKPWKAVQIARDMPFQHVDDKMTWEEKKAFIEHREYSSSTGELDTTEVNSKSV
ncbi:putative sugar transporter [Suhomyces tanzawaensis NRRL Y-17324]|uniref:Putative sugar transporter n=1 Tax=Suhomyces tanzawaensis NRRL Y-17324 TaxID=984487 RepID=A0A1E4SG92_9ASCO|nr:putative sugar transporter [Suhomyces tanzawaensis NRRL Y-17324]ODV78531.1 putative sugar transporter [Suhomyces tanzawaensis NRRL Y-17324]